MCDYCKKINRQAGNVNSLYFLYGFKNKKHPSSSLLMQCMTSE